MLAVSGTLVPLNQALLHTTTSLFKQVDFGAWFAAAAAGFAIARMFGTGRRMWLRAGAAALAGILAVAVAGALGRTQASRFFPAGRIPPSEVAVLRSLTRAYPGNYLAEDYDVPAYYLESSIPWQRWSQTWYFTYQSPSTHRLLSGATAYRAAIDDGYFSLIVLSFTDTTAIDCANRCRHAPVRDLPSGRRGSLPGRIRQRAGHDLGLPASARPAMKETMATAERTLSGQQAGTAPKVRPEPACRRRPMPRRPAIPTGTWR